MLVPMLMVLALVIVWPKVSLFLPGLISPEFLKGEKRPERAVKAQCCGARLLLGADAGELFWKRETVRRGRAGLLAAGPGRVGRRVDVEMQRVALLAPGRAGGNSVPSVMTTLMV